MDRNIKGDFILGCVLNDGGKLHSFPVIEDDIIAMHQIFVTEISKCGFKLCVINI